MSGGAACISTACGTIKHIALDLIGYRSLINTQFSHCYPPKCWFPSKPSIESAQSAWIAMAAHTAPLVNIAGLKWHRGTMKKASRAKGGTRMDSSGGRETVSDPLWGIACSLYTKIQQPKIRFNGPLNWCTEAMTFPLLLPLYI